MGYNNGNETTNRSIEEEGHLIDVLGEGFRAAKIGGGEGGEKIIENWFLKEFYIFDGLLLPDELKEVLWNTIKSSSIVEHPKKAPLWIEEL